MKKMRGVNATLQRLIGGEEPNHSWNGEEDYHNSSWRGGADSEISPGEGYERDEGEFWGSLVATTFLRQTTAGDLPQSH
ncbi:unnamed protein product [Arabidopsis halleri]